MNNLSTAPTAYKFGDRQIRVVVRGGEPWFVAADVCRAIGIGNPSMALRSLDSDEQALSSIEGISRGNDQANIVSESGMYTLVLRCRDAVTPGTAPHRFRKWVTQEVLPAIRKTGAYAAGPKADVPLLMSKEQQARIENAVHALALFAGSKGRSYRAVCLATWREIRTHFGLNEYAQLPADRFDEAMDLIVDKRAEWEVGEGARGYTLEDMSEMLHGFYLAGRVPSRVEVELARQLWMRARDAITEAKLQISGLHVAEPSARMRVRNAARVLSRRSLTVMPESWVRSVSFSREVRA